jgi:hypothetical protein
LGDLVHLLEPAILHYLGTLVLAIIGHWVELAPLGSSFVNFAYALLEKNAFSIEFTHDFDALMVYGKIYVKITHGSDSVDILVDQRHFAFHTTVCALMLLTEAHVFPIPRFVSCGNSKPLYGDSGAGI